MDGSDKSSAVLVNKNFPGVNYVYSPSSVEQRLYSTIKLIETKYVLMSGDDDLFLFSGISQCINKLEQNSEYVSAAGVALGFNYTKQKVNIFSAYHDFIKFGQIMQKSPWRRVLYHFSNYESTTVYAVVRSEVWKRTSSVLESQSTLSGNITELFIEFCNVFLGKAIVIDELMWLRSHENAPQWESFETVGLWLLSRNNENKKLLLDRIDENILSVLSRMPKKLRKLLFLKVILGKQLEYLAKQFNIKKCLKWALLPVIYVFSNLDGNIRVCLIQFVSKSRKSTNGLSTKKSSSNINSLDNQVEILSINNPMELNLVISFIEQYNTKNNLF